MRRAGGGLRPSLSLAGTELPILLLDNTQLILRVTPATTAAAAVITIRKQIGLVHDAHYGIFELGADGAFRVVDDRTMLSKVIAGWEDQESLYGGDRKSVV